MKPDHLTAAAKHMRFALSITLSHLQQLFMVYPETKPLLEGVVFCIEDALARADGKHPHA